jgi:integrase
MASLFRRGGYWHLGWQQDGKWKQVSTKFRAEGKAPPIEVHELRLRKEKEIACIAVGLEYVKPITIKEAIAEWTEIDRKTATQGTFCNHQSNVPKRLARFNDKLVAHFNEADAQEVVASMNSEPTSYSTKRSMFASFASFWKFIMAKGYSKQQFFSSQMRKKISGDRNPVMERRGLTYEEEEKIFSHLSGWGLTCAKIAIWTGARISEAVKVQREDVDFMQGEIRFKEKKAGGRPIIKSMHPSLAEFLRNLSVDDYPPKNASEDSLRDRFMKAVSMAGVPNATFHWLRHTLASRLFEEGINERDAAAILGHTQAVHKAYAHASRERLKSKLSQLKNVGFLSGS